MIQKIRSRFSAVDPGHQRLNQAAAISFGMVLSAVGSMAYVDLTKASAGLLMIGIILAMLVGRMPHDATPKKRCVTTALMWIPIALFATISVSLAGSPAIQIALLILVVGASTWVRLYGARATVLGSGAFFGYFFPLLLHLKAGDLVDFWIVAAIAVGSQTLVRAFLIIDHPRNDFLTLKHEFLRVSDALLRTAMQDGLHQIRVRHTQVERLDSVARSITAWQNVHNAKDYLGCSNFHLSSLVLNARMDLEETIAKIPILGSSETEHLTENEVGFLHEAIYELHRILDPQTHQDHAIQAASRIVSLSEKTDLSEHAETALVGLAHTATSFNSFRKLATESPRSVHVEKATVQPAQRQTVQHAKSNLQQKKQLPVFRRWKLWQPVTKMSLQIMAATALATVTGQVISATHWYWAVLTVFVVFVGGTTRAGVLTRASRRITGTVGGLACGVIFVLLFHDHKVALVALTMIAAFCMMYFGPIKYSYSAFFISAMLVGLYGLSGSLDTKVVLLRIDETVLGAIIGVACAYLLFSSNTKPEIQKRYDAFFDSLNAILNDSASVLVSAPAALSPDADSDLLDDVKRLDAAYEAIHAFTSDIAVALVGAQSSHNQPDVHRLFVSVHLAEQFSREVLRKIAMQEIDQIPSTDRELISEAINTVKKTVNDTAAVLRSRIERVDEQALVNSDNFSFLSSATNVSAANEALMEALHRLNWSLLQISTKNHMSDRKAARDTQPSTFASPTQQIPKG